MGKQVCIFHIYSLVQCWIFELPVLLQVAYVTVATRETFSKVGRELLAAIAAAHPHVISVLLERLEETIDKVGMVSTARIDGYQ